MRVWLMLLLVPLAGCLGSDDDAGTDEGDEPLPPEPVALEDAVVAWREGNQSANLNILGAWSQGGGQEADAWEDLLFVDRGSTVNIVRWALLDGNATYEEVGTVTNSAGVLDAKVSDDGRFLFVGEDAEGSTAQTGGTGPFTGGFYVYDVSDPASADYLSFLPTGPRRGPHMVFYHQTNGGDELVFGANADISINRFDRSTGTLTELSRYQHELLDTNRDPGVIDAYYQGINHDMFVMEDPVDNKTLMYVAAWDAGIRVVDVSNPATPVDLGGWNAFPEGHEGNLHTVSTEWVGDRRITVGSVEVGFAVVGGVSYATGQDRSILYVWDTTDPANIQLLGFWENPDKLPSGRDNVPGEAISSTHNLQLEGGHVYMAHYALGVYVIDVSTPEAQVNPQMVAYALLPGMNVWDVVVQDGVMFTSGSSGVQAFHYVRDVLGEGGIRSRA